MISNFNWCCSNYVWKLKFSQSNSIKCQPQPPPWYFVVKRNLSSQLNRMGTKWWNVAANVRFSMRPNKSIKRIKLLENVHTHTQFLQSVIAAIRDFNWKSFGFKPFAVVENLLDGQTYENVDSTGCEMYTFWIRNCVHAIMYRKKAVKNCKYIFHSNTQQRVAMLEVLLILNLFQF